MSYWRSDPLLKQGLETNPIAVDAVEWPWVDLDSYTTLKNFPTHTSCLVPQRFCGRDLSRQQGYQRQIKLSLKFSGYAGFSSVRMSDPPGLSRVPNSAPIAKLHRTTKVLQRSTYSGQEQTSVVNFRLMKRVMLFSN